MSLGDVVAKTPVGIRQQSTDEIRVKVYPNNESDQATIEFDNASGVKHSIHLFDMGGREVEVIRNIQGNTLHFDRNGLNDGIYIYRLTNEKGEVAYGKLILK